MQPASYSHLSFIQSEDSEWVCSQVVHQGTVFYYTVVFPETTGDCRTQVLSLIQRLDSFLKQRQLSCVILQQTVFLRNIGDKQLVRQLMLEYYGEHCPAITYVAQAPCDPSACLTVELIAVKGSVHIDHLNEKVVRFEWDEINFCLIGDETPEEHPTGAYRRSYSAFERMKRDLKNGHFDIGDIFRTWIYQGHIVLPEGDTQRYKELNRARTDFFEGVTFLPHTYPGPKNRAIYPASTGIGMNDTDVVIGCFALQTQRPDVYTIPLENPQQTSAFNYEECYSPQSPKFARAMAVGCDQYCDIFVSGTASIVDSATVHPDDPEGQTNQTLDNIRALIAGGNLARHGIGGFDATLDNLVLARVYVKYPEHRDRILALCRTRLPHVPLVATYADVCRDDLLVEIEGIVSCSRK